MILTSQQAVLLSLRDYYDIETNISLNVDRFNLLYQQISKDNAVGHNDEFLKLSCAVATFFTVTSQFHNSSLFTLIRTLDFGEWSNQRFTLRELWPFEQTMQRIRSITTTASSYAQNHHKRKSVPHKVNIEN
jgi:hypothetical protein